MASASTAWLREPVHVGIKKMLTRMPSAHLPREILHGRRVGDDVGASLGRQLLRFLRHERDLIRPDLRGHACHIRSHGHLDIQFRRDGLPEV
jgi:hypothetical protein